MSRRFYLGFLLVVFVVGAVALRWAQALPRARSGAMEAVLADGGRLIVWKASLGTNHSLVYGRWPELDSWRGRRPWLTNFLGPITERMERRSGNEVFYLFYSGVLSNGMENPHPFWARHCVDEHGCVLGSFQSRGTQRFRGTNIHDQQMEVFPRRESMVLVRFDGNERGTNEVRFRFRNPLPWQGTEWRPQSVPALATNETLRVHFEGWGGDARWPQLKFRVEEAGQTGDEWTPYLTWFEDVTGNRSQSPQLCRLEPAWRVTGRFGRRTESKLAAENSWAAFSGEIPKAGEAVEFGEAARTMEGVKARWVGVGGAGKARLESLGGWHVASVTNRPPGEMGNSMSSSNDGTQDWVETVSDKPWVVLELDGLTSDHHWQLVVVDEKGRHRANQNWSSSGGRLFVCGLDSLPAEGPVELRLVIQKLVDFSFLVTPPPLLKP
jgi:hypothetical protein